MRVIALTGKAGSGKDTVAGIIAVNYESERYAFAANIRRVLLDLDPYVHEAGCTLGELVRWEGWDTAKRSYAEIRRYMQVLGESMRAYAGARVWIDALLNEITEDVKFNGCDQVIITDLRTNTEAKALREWAFKETSLNIELEIWEIQRHGAGLTGEAGEHPTEKGIDPHYIDVTINNHGLLDDLYERVMSAYNSKKGAPTHEAD